MVCLHQSSGEQWFEEVCATKNWCNIEEKKISRREWGDIKHSKTMGKLVKSCQCISRIVTLVSDNRPFPKIQWQCSLLHHLRGSEAVAKACHSPRGSQTSEVPWPSPTAPSSWLWGLRRRGCRLHRHSSYQHIRLLRLPDQGGRL